MRALTNKFQESGTLVYKHLYTSEKRSLKMNSSWTITEIEDGQPVATVRGVSREDAVSAIYRAMRGEAVLPAAARLESAQSETGEHRVAAAA